MDNKIEVDENGNYVYPSDGKVDENGNLVFTSEVEVDENANNLEGNQAKKDEAGNSVEVKESVYELDFIIRSLELRYDEIGGAVRKAVNKRTELVRNLEMHQKKLIELQVEYEEDDIESVVHDPLEYIEGDYPFFPDENECSLDDITNIERPEICIETMKNFVAVIRKNLHRFKHLPVGPLYDCMKVTKKKWASLVEHVLRPYLFTFLVDNIVDGLVMDELIAEQFPNSRRGSVNHKGAVVPSYHIFAFNNKYEISSRMTAMTGVELENMLEIIHFNDQNWGKFLSDTIKIEKTIFLENENAAFLVMSQIQGLTELEHCKTAYTLDGFVVHPFPLFRTERIRFCRRTMYVKCMPSVDIGQVISKIRKTEARLQKLENLIRKKRRHQLRYAKHIDEFRKTFADKPKELKEKKLSLPALAEGTNGEEKDEKGRKQSDV